MAAARTKHEVEIEGRRVTLSNLDKPLYPTGFTKGQIIDFYIRASDCVLPHLARRPITLKRYPDGTQAPHFYEKDAPRFTPAWVSTFPVPRRMGGKDIRYVVVDDLAALVWCANVASIELHPFLHRAPDLDRPTSVVFDLDPGEGVGLLGAAEVALLLRDTLAHLGLQSFAKVSGSKGIQLYAPLNTPITYEKTQPFAKDLAELLARAHPRLIVSEMAKNLRKGKVFIDWSQNSDFKTTVAVYSLRAKRPAPYVSMPVTWEELDRALKKRDEAPLNFEPEAALNRMARLGDLFAPVLTMKQKLPSKVEAGAAPKRPPPEEIPFVEPMKARLAAELPQGSEWLYEIKLDGYRAVARKAGGELRLLSRNARPLNSRFPKIAAALASLDEGTIVDGEVVALDPEGRPRFNLLQNYRSVSAPIYYYCFDLLALRGRSLLHTPIEMRRELLERESGVTAIGDPVRISETLRASAREVIRAVRAQRLEGIIAKRRKSVYEPGGRSGAWVKYKVNQGQELVIGGYLPGPNVFDSLLVGYYEGPRLIFIAKVRNGFVLRTREQVAVRFRGLETHRCPFANLPEPKNARRGEALTAEVLKKCRWLKPELVAQVEYTEWTAANHLRHSRFVALRDDKDPREVVHEEPE